MFLILQGCTSDSSDAPYSVDERVSCVVKSITCYVLILMFLILQGCTSDSSDAPYSVDETVSCVVKSVTYAC